MREHVRGCNHGHSGAKFGDLGSQDVGIPASNQGIHFILVAAAPDDIQSVGSNRPGGTQNCQCFHGDPVSGHLSIAAARCSMEIWNSVSSVAALGFFSEDL